MQGKMGDKARLQHILDAIEQIKTYISGHDFKAFSEHSMLRDACIRQLQIIGEASNRITEVLRKENPHIPWQQIIGMRVIIIHKYFGIDEKIIWDIINTDLPELKAQIVWLLNKLR